jgi:UDP-N-acetylglucosamine 2-epimerase
MHKFYVHVTVHRDKFPIIKPTRCTKFSNLFWNETLHVSDSSSVHNQALFTVHSASAERTVNNS